jgi:septal ring factor EnvC (AmiA/AmiB activator)
MRTTVALIVLVNISAPFLLATQKTQLSRALQLKELIRKERPKFEEREQIKRDVLEELDRLNADQNRVRKKISEIIENQRELTMARDNLVIERDRRREAQIIERRRLAAIARFVYKIKKEGFLRFVIRGDNLGETAGRVRILYRTLRSHSLLTRQIDEHARRLEEGSAQLSIIGQELVRILQDLADQESLLANYLGRKKTVIAEINRQQTAYQLMVKEYRRISTELALMFERFDMTKSSQPLPRKASLPFPLSLGKVMTQFGRSVHEQFGTIVFHKGIEIEADHNSPVTAILNGVIEYEGWIRGLGNVLILNHGGGFYSLSARLFKTLKTKGISIEQGETIGYVGDTGTDEKPSLYFEIREGGKAVDPMAYFSIESMKNIL